MDESGDLAAIPAQAMLPVCWPTGPRAGARRVGLKKGHRCGTILCDLARGRVVDLLPNRSSETVAAWLRQHRSSPNREVNVTHSLSIEVVSRDRAGAFADAIAKGAPGAAQVADRWHLLNNCFETLARSLERHRSTLSEVAHRRSPDQQPNPLILFS